MTGRSEEPRDRLGRIADAMLKVAREHPEVQEADRAIVMLDNGELGMIAHGGYEKTDGADALVNLFAHVQALAAANGMQLDFVPMESPPGQG
jgi:hypothetical protein